MVGAGRVGGPGCPGLACPAVSGCPGSGAAGSGRILAAPLGQSWWASRSSSRGECDGVAFIVLCIKSLCPSLGQSVGQRREQFGTQAAEPSETKLGVRIP